MSAPVEERRPRMTMDAPARLVACKRPRRIRQRFDGVKVTEVQFQSEMPMKPPRNALHASRNNRVNLYTRGRDRLRSRMLA